MLVLCMKVTAIMTGNANVQVVDLEVFPVGEQQSYIITVEARYADMLIHREYDFESEVDSYE